MKSFTITGFAIFLLCSCAFAEEEFKKPKQTGFVFISPGAFTVNVDARKTIEIGGGYEGFLYKGLGLGFDVGGIQQLSPGSSNWTGITTLYAIYDFQRAANQKLCPYVFGGGTAIPASDVSGGYNLGGGVKYWFAKHAGLKLDFRFHARPGNLRTYDDIQARIGIAFR